jgi:dTDP-4-dehydrorhamnose reductase
MNGKKILITGSDGVLGSNLVKEFSNAIGFSKKDLDVTNLFQIQEVIDRIKPDIIIHCAALTDVEYCENEIDKTFEVNTIGTQNIAKYCIDKNILFIFISSTGIYGSYKTNRYSELDKVVPLTIHHKSKYEAELFVQNHLNKYLILRTGWIFGGEKHHKKNFVYQRYLDAKKNNLIYSNNTQIGNPTYVLDLIKQIKILIDKNQIGVFNCVNQAENVSRYDYVKKIIELFDLNCKVKEASPDMFKRIAPVSNNESALNHNLELLKINCMGNWDDALERYIDELKNKI